MVVQRKPKQKPRKTKDIFKGNDEIIRNSILAILGTLAVLGTTKFVVGRMRGNEVSDTEHTMRYNATHVASLKASPEIRSTVPAPSYNP